MAANSPADTPRNRARCPSPSALNPPAIALVAQIDGGKTAPTRLSRLFGDVKNAARLSAVERTPSAPPSPIPPADRPSPTCTATDRPMRSRLPARMSASFFRLTLTTRINATTASDTSASGMTGSAA